MHKSFSSCINFVLVLLKVKICHGLFLNICTSEKCFTWRKTSSYRAFYMLSFAIRRYWRLYFIISSIVISIKNFKVVLIDSAGPINFLHFWQFRLDSILSYNLSHFTFYTLYSRIIYGVHFISKIYIL